MGLHSVELVIDVEEKFSIRLPDEALGEVRTVGELFALILEHLPKSTSGCPTAQRFYELRRDLIAAGGVERAAVKPSAALEDLLPKPSRRTQWNKLDAISGPLPRLQTPSWFLRLFWPVCLAAMASVASVCWLVGTQMSLSVWVLLFALACSLVLSLLLVLFVWFWIHDRYAVNLPAGCQTIADLVRATLSPQFSEEKQNRQAFEQEIFQQLRELVSDVGSINIENVRKDSRFIQDLKFG